MFTRFIRQRLEEALGDTPAVVLHGARQSGKTTLVRMLIGRESDERRYMTFDDMGVLAAARIDPMGFVDALPGQVILDEIQRAPSLFPAIKMAIDRDRRPGRFLMTGSANVFSLPRLSESLAGRVEIVPLFPLTQGEIDDDRHDFIAWAFGDKAATDSGDGSPFDVWGRVFRGGFPEVVVRRTPARRRAWFDAYVTTILQRDVRDLSNIESLEALPRLLALLATRLGGLLNIADLGSALSMPASTLKRYLALLEATFLLHRLPAWTSNLGLRLIKSPKMYFTDVGLASHYLAGEPAQLETDPTRKGPLLENLVFTELRAQATWSSTPVRLFHYRTLAKQEVDFVLESSTGSL
ncbi:MAG TPA: ATP-binding protein, partial [Planctomycetes bacterium]|nr:ATP-binding protein [Planctomycetota bacterium]